MGLYAKIEVFMEDWGFRIVPKGDPFAGDDELEDITMEEIEQHLQAEREMDWFEGELYKSLTDRANFEHDVNNEVVKTFMDAIINYWRSHCEWEEMVYFVDKVKEGEYDDEMKRYYVYQQAESLIDNLFLIDFSGEDNIKDILEDVYIYVYDDDIMYRSHGVIKSVDRTFDLKIDVKRLLVLVVRSLKFSGETIDFTKGC